MVYNRAMGSTFDSKFRTAWSVFRSAWIAGRPFLLYFKPTARCDLKCAICDRWKVCQTSEGEMDLDQIERMLTEFRAAGATILTLWGGEPTLRKDLPEILSVAGNLGYRTAMCTNCNSLAKKADRLMPHLDTLLCSLDGVGKVHDKARGVDGLFDRVIAGIEAAKKFEGKRIKIWATVNNNNLHQIEELAELAADLSVGIEFFPVSPVPGYNNDVVCDEAALADAFGRVLKLKKQGLPIWNPDKVLGIMAGNEPFKCNFGKIAVQVDQTGIVHCCEEPSGTPLHELGNHADMDIKELFKSDKYRAAVEDLSHCNRCRLPCVVELADNLPLALGGMFGRAMVK